MPKDFPDDDDPDTVAELMDILASEARALLSVKQELTFATLMDGGDADTSLLKSLQERGLESIEIYWNGKTVKAYFNKPVEHKSLSEVAKRNFMSTVDLTTSEGRMKTLIDETAELKDGMKFRHKLSTFWLYSVMREAYDPFKKFIFFLLVLLNFNVLFSQYDDPTQCQGEVANDQPADRHLRLWRNIRNDVLSYSVQQCVLHLQHHEQGVHLEELRDAWHPSLIIFFSPSILRSFFRIPQSRLMQNYCRTYDVIMDPTLRNHALLLFIVLIGENNPLWYAFALLDILNLKGGPPKRLAGRYQAPQSAVSDTFPICDSNLRLHCPRIPGIWKCFFWEP